MKPVEKFGRRRFLAGAGAALAARSGAAQSGKPVRFGLIGCGGRGRYVSGFLIEAGGQLVALADLFEDKVTSAKAQLDAVLQKQGLPPVEPTRLYQGPEAVARMANSDVDAVLMTMTPYFYPQALDIVVRAGKHVYCEKPVATDVAGCLKVIDIGRKAEGKIVLHIGLQLRYVPALQELVRRVHAGAIGDVVTAESCFYYGGGARRAPAGVSPAEARIRTWAGDRILSGDIIVEQNVHSIDKINWMLRGHPVSAVATGGRSVRTDFGDVWDHYEAILHYPNKVAVAFRSTQFLKGWTDVAERFFGSRGVTEAHYDGPVKVYGEQPWDAGVTGTRAGAEAVKARAFIEDIRTRNMRNEALQGAESTLSAILVRTAAYSGREVTWDEMVSSNAKWDAHIDLAQFG